MPDLTLQDALAKLVDHETRIGKLEADDAAVKAVALPLLNRLGALAANPWVSHTLTALAMAAILWAGSKVNVSIETPPAEPPGVVKPASIAPNALPEKRPLNPNDS